MLVVLLVFAIYMTLALARIITAGMIKFGRKLK